MKIGKSLRNFFAPSSQEHQPDRWFLIAAGVLLIIGLVMLSSASSVVSYVKYGNTYHYFFRQLFFVTLGLGAFWGFYKIDYRLWRRYAVWALFISIFLLVLVFIPGLRSEYGTAHSWITIFGQSLQPSEFVKLSFLIYLATWLEAKKGQLNKATSGIIPFLSSLVVISALMMAQPDIGTLFIILFWLKSQLFFLLKYIRTLGANYRNVMGHKELSHTIYPNPFQQSFEVELNMTQGDKVHFTLYDGMGKTVRKVLETMDAGNQLMTIDAADLPPSIYVYTIETPDGFYRGKLVKENN